ncbi:MAG: hypothetical protein FJY86_01515 [Candidatus Diapherotrites archaeon]|uniref:Nop domain-containing protein n=1 Tax=Candidatus Iainarchaeum sp. TaxID=3101447 RepID=A0A8T4C6A7_9ARCH|nr:hypothetical protein [Candidatus Diapherotrites archaeon]
MPMDKPFSGASQIHALRKRLMEQTKWSISTSLSSKDAHVIRAVQTSKNLEAIYNLLFEQTLEWYALHFPEIRQMVRDPLNVLGIVVRAGPRSKITREVAGQFYTDDYSIARLTDAAAKSAGGDLDENALRAIQGVAQTALDIKKEQTRLNDFVVRQMKDLAPNFSELATPTIAAQLLAKAGSLKHLSELPGSTIQVMGAEEALFSHLKTKTRPPKHGYLFNHPLVKPLPKHARGRMARTLAGKLAICIRVDVFGQSRVVDQYKPALEALSKRLAKSSPRARKSLNVRRR